MTGRGFPDRHWRVAVGALLGLILLLSGQCGAQSSSNPASPANPAVVPGASVASVSPSPAATATSAGSTAGEATKRGDYSKLMLFAYVILLIVFVGGLHLIDSFQAYSLARGSDQLWTKLPNNLSADEAEKLLKSLPQEPNGIAGTTRSILTYSLILILGIAVFDLLTVSVDPKAGEYADKLLTLLGGSLTTIIGFYFGAKATTEGVSAGKTQDAEKPRVALGRIDKVDPSHAKMNDSVIISGSGFGPDQGNVQFGQIAAEQIETWADTSIKVKVPLKLPFGAADVFVNPPHGERIVGKGLFTKDS